MSSLLKESLIFSDTSCSFLCVPALHFVYSFIIVLLILSLQVHVPVPFTSLKCHHDLCFINALYYLLLSWYLVYICWLITTGDHWNQNWPHFGKSLGIYWVPTVWPDCAFCFAAHTSKGQWSIMKSHNICILFPVCFFVFLWNEASHWTGLDPSLLISKVSC